MKSLGIYELGYFGLKICKRETPEQTLAIPAFKLSGLFCSFEWKWSKFVDNLLSQKTKQTSRRDGFEVCRDFHTNKNILSFKKIQFMTSFVFWSKWFFKFASNQYCFPVSWINYFKYKSQNVLKQLISFEEKALNERVFLD